MKVLITGVAGLIGSRMADWLIEEKKEVRVIGVDDLSGGYRDNVHPEVDFHQIEISSEKFSALVDECKPDYVFHLAAYAAEGLSPFIRCFNYKNNLVATANVINSCIRNEVKRLVFTSSMAVYGEGNPPFDESNPQAPVDPYGIAKYACEMDIKIAGEQHNLDWCIIRPHNVYGEKQNIWDKYRNVLGIWMYQHLNGEAMTIFGDGSQERAFSYVGDSLPSLWEAAVSPKASKEIFNVGAKDNISIKNACNLLLEVIGGGECVHLEQRHEVKHAFSTWGKSEKLLGYKDATPLREGLEKMWTWAKAQPKRDRKAWDKYELDVGLYSFWKNKD